MTAAEFAGFDDIAVLAVRIAPDKAHLSLGALFDLAAEGGYQLAWQHDNF